ncbi:MAG: hypothetical protein AB8B79_19565 [Granulosicoccus sp.]
MKFRQPCAGILLLGGCGGGSSGGPSSPAVTVLAGLENCIQAESNQSLLCGTALAADGTTPLIGALITINDSASGVSSSSELTLRGIANDSQCITDFQGEYACVIPNSVNGMTTFSIDAEGFVRTTFQASVQQGQIATVESQQLQADDTVQWAVVPGLYDGVQVLLAQLKGCTLNDDIGNPWNNNNPDPSSARGSTDCESKGLRVLEENETAFFTDGSLDQFDALFINCDADLSANSAINTAIRDFNDDGKHVYFSDLSDVWLEELFPNQIEFAGNDTSSASSVPAQAVDANLAAVVGDTIDLVFDFSIWTAIDSVSSSSTVYIEADITDISGYDGVKPITVGFQPQGSSACVFFTSYHIEGASVGSDQELAMKYLIQNIASVCT